MRLGRFGFRALTQLSRTVPMTPTVMSSTGMAFLGLLGGAAKAEEGAARAGVRLGKVD